jgi:hypothetical protein
MDPFSVLGVGRDAPPEAVTAAYRRLAKRWHPDRATGPEAVTRMAEINAAYDLLRAGLAGDAADVTSEPEAEAAPRERPPVAAAWLPPELRRALGPELRRALQDGEDVAFVVPAATWASPDALLAVTDRRLLWLLTDVVGHRVRSLRFADVDRVQHRLSWPRRRTAVLHVRTASGRGLSFAELPPATAAGVARHVADRLPGRGRAAA